MDPWMRFERALQTLDDPTAELWLVLGDLDSADLGTQAERQELRASATALLARTGETPLGNAIEECSRAWALGQLGWPSLYLGWAAMSQGQPQVAIDSVRKVPEGYFDDQDLHWRTVQLVECEADARLALGERAEATRLVSELNREFRAGSVDEILSPPTGLVRRMLTAGPPYDLLSALVEGLTLADWFSTDLAEAIADAIDR